jgi:hypothetical protein
MRTVQIYSFIWNFVKIRKILLYIHLFIFLYHINHNIVGWLLYVFFVGKIILQNKNCYISLINSGSCEICILFLRAPFCLLKWSRKCVRYRGFQWHTGLFYLSPGSNPASPLSVEKLSSEVKKQK